MKVTETALPGVIIIEPDVYGDSRGFFLESYSSSKLADYSLTDSFIQDNHSFTQNANTLRGLHYQRDPHSQIKIVRCTRGRVLDVAVDIRAEVNCMGKSAGQGNTVFLLKGVKGQYHLKTTVFAQRHRVVGG